MARFIAGKVLHLAIVLLLVSIALSFLIQLTPGDPAFAILGSNATPDQVKLIHRELHLDDPFLVRYLDWLVHVVRLDFGTSLVTNQPVIDALKDRLPVTVELIMLTLLLSLAVSVPIGIHTAYRADGAIDRFWAGASSTMVAVPSFVGALLIVYVLAVKLKGFPIHFPATGWTPLTDDIGDNLWHICLPVITLSLVEIPNFSRLLRADMISTLQEDFILAARARGVPTRRILFRHALRPSLFSLVTVAALSLGRLIGGAVIVEVLFALPGLGQLLIQSILNKDEPAVQGVVMFIAIVYVLVNAFLDLVYGFVDPRIRTQTVGG